MAVKVYMSTHLHCFKCFKYADIFLLEYENIVWVHMYIDKYFGDIIYI